MYSTAQTRLGSWGGGRSSLGCGKMGKLRRRACASDHCTHKLPNTSTCSYQMDYKSMGQIFKGLAQVGRVQWRVREKEGCGRPRGMLGVECERRALTAAATRPHPFLYNAVWSVGLP